MILEKYGEASGQQINLEKFSVLFTKNISEEFQWVVCKEHGKLKKVTQGKYLGLFPMIVTRAKNQLFGFIKERLKQKLQGWKGKLSSQASKKVLLKSLALALPEYVMSCFRLSNNLCK